MTLHLRCNGSPRVLILGFGDFHVLLLSKRGQFTPLLTANPSGHKETYEVHLHKDFFSSRLLTPESVIFRDTTTSEQKNHYPSAISATKEQTLRHDNSQPSKSGSQFSRPRHILHPRNEYNKPLSYPSCSILSPICFTGRKSAYGKR